MLKVSVVIVAWLILAMALMYAEKHQNIIALVDPTQLSSAHANLMKQVLEAESANYVHYDDGIINNLTKIAQFREASIIVIPRSLTVYGCDNAAEMGAVINALHDLSQVASVYASAYECDAFDPFLTTVSVIDKNGIRPAYLPALIKQPDLQIEACYFGYCYDSYAIVKAGIVQSSGW